MNIDDLTLGQCKELATMFGNNKSTVRAPTQKMRAVVVVDRGWIFAGDLSDTVDGYLKISNAVHVFRWESMGFAKMIEDWKNDKVDLRPCDDVELPYESVIFRVQVSDRWGIR